MTRGILLVDMAPADCWEDAFPVGNGRHGALVHGRPGAERVVITHHDLTWPDSPAAPGPPDLAGRLGGSPRAGPCGCRPGTPVRLAWGPR